METTVATADCGRTKRITPHCARPHFVASNINRTYSHFMQQYLRTRVEVFDATRHHDSSILFISNFSAEIFVGPTNELKMVKFI